MSRADQYPADADGYIVYGPQIGEGAFARVYRAKVRTTGEDVAIKTLQLEKYKDTLDDIRKEISIMSQMRHPNLVRVVSSFVWHDELWIVMPLLVGGSCHAMMKQTFPKGFKDEAVLATIIREVLKGLEYVHSNKLIHRDIKAGNVLIAAEGGVQLADFGVAGALTEGGESKSRRTFTGTPCWMAPEVMEQTNGYDVKADIWSVGITALELAMGSAPYAHFQPMKVLLLTLQEKPPSFDSYPQGEDNKFSKDFKKFIGDCLKKDPKDRSTVKKLLGHSWLKKATTLDYIKTKLVEPTLKSQAGKELQELDLKSGQANIDADDTDDGFWELEFDPEDLVKARNGEVSELNPISSKTEERKDDDPPKPSPEPSPEPAKPVLEATELGEEEDDDDEDDDEGLQSKWQETGTEGDDS